MDYPFDRDPFRCFENWLKSAEQTEINDPNAMALGSVDSRGRPSVRMVLLKSFDRQGFVFYTNQLSRKGQELQQQPAAALCFHWKSLLRQIRIEGTVSLVESEKADAYFASRPRGSQLGAWISKQSQPMPNTVELQNRQQELSRRFEGQPIPRPESWVGYRLRPDAFEFWLQGDDRLHTRFRFELDHSQWQATRLFP